MPRWHAKSSRWRLTINHNHGQKDFYWSAEQQTASPPPEVIASAVTVQNEWAEIKKDWGWIGPSMQCDQPEKDWSSPVWIDTKSLETSRNRVDGELIADELKQQRSTLYSVAERGFGWLIAAAQQPHALDINPDKSLLHRERPELAALIDAENESMRLRLVSEITPLVRSKEIISVRDAMISYLAYHERRSTLKVGDWIEKSTFKTNRKQLLMAFGLSSERSASNQGGKI